MLFTEDLKDRLSVFNYNKADSGMINGISYITVLRTPRLSTVRCLCAVVEVPKNVTDLEDLQDFFEEIRKSLTIKYAWSPSWKELCTYTILLCEHNIYVKIKGKEKLFIDKTGFHSNTMLGSFFIDTQTFENTQKATWGLVSTGKHFKEIESVITEWCNKQMNQ